MHKNDEASIFKELGLIDDCKLGHKNAEASIFKEFSLDKDQIIKWDLYLHSLLL